MTRPECWGRKEDHSDKCDLYDSEGWCHWYGDTWLCEKDGLMHGGEEVELITYCTHRTRKGKRINDSMNPLHMERIPRWCEVIFDGEICSLHNHIYNPEGIMVWGDGTMHDPVSKKTVCPDGTVIENDHWGGNRAMHKSFEASIEQMKVTATKLAGKKAR